MCLSMRSHCLFIWRNKTSGLATIKTGHSLLHGYSCQQAQRCAAFPTDEQAPSRMWETVPRSIRAAQVAGSPGTQPHGERRPAQCVLKFGKKCFGKKPSLRAARFSESLKNQRFH